MTTISYNFKLTTLQPGSRGYNNATFEPVDDVIVSVDVPVKFVKNGAKILAQPFVGGESTPITPILTVEGWAYLEDMFLGRKVEEEPLELDESKIDWEDE